VVEYKDTISGYKLTEDQYLPIEKAELAGVKVKGQGHLL
jgi:non-homologous end joining protein Ku